MKWNNEALQRSNNKYNCQLYLYDSQVSISGGAIPWFGPRLSWSISPLHYSSHTNTLTSPQFTLAWGLPAPLAAAVDADEGTASLRRPCLEAPCLAAWTCSHHRKRDPAADPPLTPWGPPLCWVASPSAGEKKVHENEVKRRSSDMWTSSFLVVTMISL